MNLLEACNVRGEEIKNGYRMRIIIEKREESYGFFFFFLRIELGWLTKRFVKLARFTDFSFSLDNN